MCASQCKVGAPCDLVLLLLLLVLALAPSASIIQIFILTSSIQQQVHVTEASSKILHRAVIGDGIAKREMAWEVSLVRLLSKRIRMLIHVNNWIDSRNPGNLLFPCFFLASLVCSWLFPQFFLVFLYVSLAFLCCSMFF